jgi:alkylation response protein AidB-like acyl-CoA dehydrogenase
MIAPAGAESELGERARAFVDEVLIPLEEQAERAHGRLPGEAIERVKREAIERRLSGGLHRAEHGGQGWTHVEWFLVEEQFGRSTNAISWHVPTAYNVLAHGTPEQIDRWLRPALRGELHDAYAVTEEHAGSDPSAIATTATPLADGGWRIDGEKWFVTYGDVASVLVVMALAPEPTLFLVDASLPGVRVVDDPPFTHSYPHGHPTIRFDGVEVGAGAVIGGVGGGDELQRAWFVEERLGIAARGVGAMWRLLEETTAWAVGREQGGARLIDHQGVAFPLADSAADAAAGRLLALEVARLADDPGADPKLVHAKASLAKLFVSEAANRCADRCLQAFGGRGYTRTNVAERFWRELRVDRIWEGTSEIQRLIVARALERRGVQRVLH